MSHIIGSSNGTQQGYPSSWSLLDNRSYWPNLPMPAKPIAAHVLTQSTFTSWRIETSEWPRHEDETVQVRMGTRERVSRLSPGENAPRWPFNTPQCPPNTAVMSITTCACGL
jgi:hypothetical protein